MVGGAASGTYGQPLILDLRLAWTEKCLKHWSWVTLLGSGSIPKKRSYRAVLRGRIVTSQLATLVVVES